MGKVLLRSSEDEEMTLMLPREVGLPATVEMDVKGVTTLFELDPTDLGKVPVYVQVASLDFWVEGP